MTDIDISLDIYCSICDRKLAPICETKHIDGVNYCIECYRTKIYPERMKKLREMKNQAAVIAA